MPSWGWDYGYPNLSKVIAAREAKSAARRAAKWQALKDAFARARTSRQEGS